MFWAAYYLVNQTTTLSTPRVAAIKTLTALNIALFPPLFFFSGLFYTDVVSTALVLLCLTQSTPPLSNQSSLTWHDILSVLAGAGALFCRQTNVFWVALFPAGIRAIQALKMAEEKHQPDRTESETALSVVIQRSWYNSVVYDPPYGHGESILGDLLKTAVSTALSALRTMLIVLRATIPQIVLLAAFASFILWNGGVVLGI